MTTTSVIHRKPRSFLKTGNLSLRTWLGALAAVLLVRIVLGLWVLPVSARFPDTPLEQNVSVVPGTAPIHVWLHRTVVQPWIRYDAWNYIRIAEHGYRAEEGTAAFHPLYPLLTAPVSWLLTGNTGLALLIVATIASVVLCVVFTRYTEHVHGGFEGSTAAWLLLVCPVGFIMLAPYNEGLFLALAIGSTWCIHRRYWWWAGLLGGLAALTRQQGLALVLPLAWQLGSTIRNKQTRIWNVGALFLIPFGYSLFVAYRAFVLGDLHVLAQAQGPADFLRSLLVSRTSETVVPGQHITWPWVPLIDQLRLIFTSSENYHLIIDLVLGWSAVLVILWGWRIMTMPERLYSLAIAGLSLCYYNGIQSPYLSLPRHMLLAFPIFIVLASWGSTGKRRRVMIEVLLCGNLFLAAAFVRHGWVP